MSNKQDLRFVKTERLIIDTYLELKTRNQSPVKVSDLCAAALINKSTFYAHYETMEDLHDKVCKLTISKMLSEAPGNELAFTDTRVFVESIVKTLQKNKAFLDMLFGNNRIKEINAVEHYILDTRLYDVESEDIKMEFLFAIGGAARLLVFDQSQERIEKAIQLIQRVLDKH